jgi:hypothetical protein
MPEPGKGDMGWRGDLQTCRFAAHCFTQAVKERDALYPVTSVEKRERVIYHQSPHCPNLAEQPFSSIIPL